MIRTKTIIIVLLTILLKGSCVVVSAQVKGSPENHVNAIDYRYQYFNGKLPRFSDTVEFREKLYNIIGVGYVADWENSNNAGSLNGGWITRIGIGYRFTPVHAAEIDFMTGNINKDRTLGIDANYVMNINNYAYRKDGRYKFEASLIAGLSYRYAHEHIYGLNSGVRLQWNPHLNIGIYVEPKLNVLTTANKTRTFMTQPVVTAGLAISYHRPELTLGYYMRRFANKHNLAFKTNLLTDIAAVPSMGIELSLGKNYTVSTNWMYSWWSDRDNGFVWRTYGGELAIRKWFGRRAEERPVTGHHIGLYGQCITYDFAINGYGQIGGASEKSLKEEPNWGGGIEYGYSFPVTDHLNIDLSIGAGYFGGKYTDYIPMEDCLVIQSTKRRQWIGPSKAEVSLVWLLFNTESYKGKVDKK